MATEKHKYEQAVDLSSDTAPARVLRMIEKGSKVLEIGAGPGSTTRCLSGLLDCDVVALEIDPAALEKLKGCARSVYAMDLNDSAWSDVLREKEGLFDYIIAADVLEHVYDPWIVLGGMRSLLNENGAVLLSIPHVGHAAIGACLIDEDFEYRQWGLLDWTHIRFFGVKNVQELCASQNMAIEKAEFVVRTPEMTEFAHRWIRLPDDVKEALQRNRFSDVYQIIIKARPVEKVTQPIRLMDLEVIPPEPRVSSYWKKAMSSIRPDPDSDQSSTIVSRKTQPLWRGTMRTVARKFGL